jgi:hypothetical protein
MFVMVQRIKDLLQRILAAYSLKWGKDILSLGYELNL